MSSDTVNEARKIIQHKPAVEALVHGVCVVTSKAGERQNGLSVAWVSQASMNPILVSVAVNKRWYSHDLLAEGDHFAVHILADDQVNLGKKFGYVSGRNHDKFEGVDWMPGYMGLPVLKDCKAVLGCKKVNMFDAGDHSLFIGEVEFSEFDESKTSQVLDLKIYYP